MTDECGRLLPRRRRIEESRFYQTPYLSCATDPGGADRVTFIRNGSLRTTPVTIDENA